MAKLKYSLSFLFLNLLLLAPVALSSASTAEASTYKAKSITTNNLNTFTKKGTLPDAKGSIGMTYKDLKKKVNGDAGLTEGNLIAYQGTDGATYIFKANGTKDVPKATARVEAINKVYFKQATTKEDLQKLYGTPKENLYKSSKYYVGFASYAGNTTLSIGNYDTMQFIAAISNY